MGYIASVGVSTCENRRDKQSSNCGKRLDIKLEISIYICAHICICICICARLHIWVVRMFKNGFIAWSA